jgi:hypothetical protein
LNCCLALGPHNTCATFLNSGSARHLLSPLGYFGLSYMSSVAATSPKYKSTGLVSPCNPRRQERKVDKLVSYHRTA